MHSIYETSLLTITHWTLIVFVIYFLPQIIKKAKLDDKIDARMQNTIRGVLIAYFIVTVVLPLCNVIVSFGESIVFWIVR